MNKISIIIPCKNKCNIETILNKLISQKYKHPQTEIIVVENGSSDDMSFLNNYDITLIHTDIANVSHARNTALDMCLGDYICFVDNDDDISDRYLDVIYENIESGYDWYVWRWCSDETKVFMFDLDINNPLKQNWALWGYCFKRELWKNKRFPVKKQFGEDYIIFDIITKETKGYFIKEFMYFYKYHNNINSLSHRHWRGEI